MRDILTEHNTTILSDTTYGKDPGPQLQQIEVQCVNSKVTVCCIQYLIFLLSTLSLQL